MHFVRADPWFNGAILKDRFPRLFAIASNTDGTVILIGMNQRFHGALYF